MRTKHKGLGRLVTNYESAPRFESKLYYGMDSIRDALYELEFAMERDPMLTIWALQGILERDDDTGPE